MFSPTDFWAGAVLPAAVAAGVLLAGWRLARRRMPARDSRSWAGGAAVAAGFVAGYWALFGRPELPPLDAVDWLFYLAPIVGLASLGESWFRLRWPARIVLVALAVGATLLVVAGPILSAQAGQDAALRVLWAALVAFAAIGGLDALSQRVSAARLNAILLALAVPAAVVLALSGSLRLGQIGGLLAATAAGSLVANLLLGSAAVARGTVLVLGTLLAGLLLCGHLYAELTTGAALLLAAASTMSWLAQLLPKRMGRLTAVAVQLTAVAGVGGVAVLRAWLQFVEDSA